MPGDKLSSPTIKGRRSIMAVVFSGKIRFKDSDDTFIKGEPVSLDHQTDDQFLLTAGSFQVTITAICEKTIGDKYYLHGQGRDSSSETLFDIALYRSSSEGPSYLHCYGFLEKGGVPGGEDGVGVWGADDSLPE
jgi:hypothetical protein